MVKKVVKRKGVTKKAAPRKIDLPTMKIVGEREIAMDFAMKTYEKFDQMIKSVVLFGSSAKKIAVPGNDLNFVSMDHEMAKLGANSLRFKVLGKLVSHHLGILKYAAQNGR